MVTTLPSIFSKLIFHLCLFFNHSVRHSVRLSVRPVRQVRQVRQNTSFQSFSHLQQHLFHGCHLFAARILCPVLHPHFKHPRTQNKSLVRTLFCQVLFLVEIFHGKIEPLQERCKVKPLFFHRKTFQLAEIRLHLITHCLAIPAPNIRIIGNERRHSLQPFFFHQRGQRQKFIHGRIIHSPEDHSVITKRKKQFPHGKPVPEFRFCQTGFPFRPGKKPVSVFLKILLISRSKDQRGNNTPAPLHKMDLLKSQSLIFKILRHLSLIKQLLKGHLFPSRFSAYPFLYVSLATSPAGMSFAPGTLPPRSR